MPNAKLLLASLVNCKQQHATYTQVCVVLHSYTDRALLYIMMHAQVKDIDDRIETERERLKQEREAKDANIMQQKVGGLEMAHRRRIMALETRLAEEMKGLRARQLQELEDVSYLYLLYELHYALFALMFSTAYIRTAMNGAIAAVFVLTIITR
jgi:hypothetical protein